MRLEVQGLEKRFGGVIAVAGVSFGVGAGEAVALLGPNGAGKTTTASMICGLIRPDSGRTLLDGREVRGDADPRKRALGLVPQELALVEELTARRNLRFFGSIQGLGGRNLRLAVDRGLDLVGLASRADDAVRNFSGGMKRRLNLAAALLHDPHLIVLDEPTVGVDPQSRNAIFEGLEGLKARGKAILYATHYMEEAERLCDRAVIIDRGRVVADAPIADLSGPARRGTRIEVDLGDDDPATWLARARAIPGVLAAECEGARLIVDLDGLRVAARLLDELHAAGAKVVGLSTDRPDLQAAFLHLTGSGTRDA